MRDELTKIFDKHSEVDIISPDGFAINREGTFKSVDEAMDALNSFVLRYSIQGYYSSVKYGKILLNDLPKYCSIEIIK